MARMTDRWQSRYIDNMAVANGATLLGPWLLMDAAAGLSVQMFATNGAAGTVYIDGSNQDGGLNYLPVTNQTVAANGSVYFAFGPSDQPTAFAIARVRFVASAAGNVTVATNVRRYVP